MVDLKVSAKRDLVKIISIPIRYVISIGEIRCRLCQYKDRHKKNKMTSKYEDFSNQSQQKCKRREPLLLFLSSKCVAMSFP